jgi:hypothetical protein
MTRPRVSFGRQWAGMRSSRVDQPIVTAIHHKDAAVGQRRPYTRTCLHFTTGIVEAGLAHLRCAETEHAPAEESAGPQPTLRVAVDLSGPASRCLCPSREIPCKPVLGLLLLWPAGEAMVGEVLAPAYVVDWLAGRAERAEGRAGADSAASRQRGRSGGAGEAAGARSAAIRARHGRPDGARPPLAQG